MPPLRHADMQRRSDAPAVVNLCALQFPLKGNFVGTDNPNSVIHETSEGRLALPPSLPLTVSGGCRLIWEAFYLSLNGGRLRRHSHLQTFSDSSVDVFGLQVETRDEQKS